MVFSYNMSNIYYVPNMRRKKHEYGNGFHPGKHHGDGPLYSAQHHQHKASQRLRFSRSLLRPLSSGSERSDEQTWRIRLRLYWRNQPVPYALIEKPHKLSHDFRSKKNPRRRRNKGSTPRSASFFKAAYSPFHSFSFYGHGHQRFLRG